MLYRVLDTEVEISDEEAADIRAKYLKNYVYLQRVVDDLDAETALKAMCLELADKNREQIVSRLYGIYNKDKRSQEREMLGLK